MLLTALARVSLLDVRRLPHALTVLVTEPHRVLLGVLELDTEGFFLLWHKNHLFQNLRAS